MYQQILICQWRRWVVHITQTEQEIVVYFKTIETRAVVLFEQPHRTLIEVFRNLVKQADGLQNCSNFHHAYSKWSMWFQTWNPNLVSINTHYNLGWNVIPSHLMLSTWNTMNKSDIHSWNHIDHLLTSEIRAIWQAARLHYRISENLYW